MQATSSKAGVSTRVRPHLEQLIDGVDKVLVAAEEFAAQVRREAERDAQRLVAEAGAKAEGIVAEAGSKADGMIADASAQAEQVLADTDRRVERVLARETERRTALETEIADLTARRDDLAGRLREVARSLGMTLSDPGVSQSGEAEAAPADTDVEVAPELRGSRFKRRAKTGSDSPG